jgi:hypothetical protein
VLHFAALISILFLTLYACIYEAKTPVLMSREKFVPKRARPKELESGPDLPNARAFLSAASPCSLKL